MAKAKITTAQAIAELKALGKELKALKVLVSKTTKTNSASFKAMETSIQKIRTTTIKTNNKMVQLTTTVKKQAKQINQLTKANQKVAKSQKKVTKSSKQMSTGFKSMFKGVKALIAAFGIIAGVQIFGRILKSVFETIRTFDSLNFAMKAITKTTWNYVESQTFLISLTKEFGVDLVATAERWIKFRAAAAQSNVTLRDTENIFRSMTKAGAVLGLKTDELRGIYLALEQMLSKGKVTTEELRRQLGERLPGAMGIMAASMGISIDKLDKMMKLGQVLSAEVLPDFARAVEIAYGIQTVDTVETLQASLGRMASSWQIFVDNVINGEGVVSDALASMFNWIAKINRVLTERLGSRKANFLIDLADAQRVFIKSFKKDIEDGLGVTESIEKILAEIEDLGDQAKGKTGDALNKINDEVREKTHELLEIAKKTEAEMKAVAFLGFPEAQANFNKDRKLFDDRIEALEKIEKLIKSNTDIGGFKGLILSEDDRNRYQADNVSLKDRWQLWNKGKKAMSDAVKDTEKLSIGLDELTENAKNSEAIYREFLKLVEAGSGGGSGGDDITAIAQRQLKEKFDLTIKIQMKIREATIAHNKLLIKDEKTGLDTILQLKLDNFELERQNAELAFLDAQKRIATKAKNESDSWEASFAKGAASAEKLATAQLNIKTEADDLIILAEIEKNKRLDAIAEGRIQLLVSAEKDIIKLKGSEVKDEFSIRVILLKNELDLINQIGGSSKRRIEIEQELRDIAVESGNLQLDILIQILELRQRNATDQSVIAALQREINALEAMKAGLEPPSNIATWEEWFEQIAELAAEFNAAIGDLVDAGFERRIENINAEIEAETRKFDKLIELARDNEEEQQTLRRNKEVAIRKLEKKRLKEEQKQAKARKVFAIADIAINTAVAVMRAWSDAGPFGGPIFAAIIAALGAVQIATVLAQPIPQFKKGGNITKDMIAMVNDGLVKEYIEREGNILTTDKKDAIVPLKRGDIVYKDYDAMIRNSTLASAMTGGSSISENDFNKMFLGLETAVKDGFKKAKINNNISIGTSNQEYKREMSRWN